MEKLFLPLPTFGGCWHALVCGHITPGSISSSHDLLLFQCQISPCLPLLRTFVILSRATWTIQETLPISRSLAYHICKVPFTLEIFTAFRDKDLDIFGRNCLAYHNITDLPDSDGKERYLSGGHGWAPPIDNDKSRETHSPRTREDLRNENEHWGIISPSSPMWRCLHF